MSDLTTTARATGGWYLGLVITGVLGFLVVRPAIYVQGDPAATLGNLTDKEGLAHLAVLLEVAIVVTQALAALWFYKLLRTVRPVAGVSVAAFGLVNAVAIMASAVCVATAVAVAADASLAPGGDAAAAVGLLFQLSNDFWGIGAVFFGLWLIPMGWAAVVTGRFPRVLGWVLVVGGVSYMHSALVSYGLVDAPGLLINGLAFPATIGEFWMIGYLLIRGIRPEPAVRQSESAVA